MKRFYRMIVCVALVAVVFGSGTATPASALGINDIKKLGWRGSYMLQWRLKNGRVGVHIHISAADIEASGTDAYCDTAGDLLAGGVEVATSGSGKMLVLPELDKLASVALKRLISRKDGSIDLVILQLWGNWGFLYKGTREKMFPVPLSTVTFAVYFPSELFDLKGDMASYNLHF